MPQPVSPESLTKRLIERHHLNRIAIVTQDGRLFTATALPSPRSPVVKARHEAAFAAHPETTCSLKEASAINQKAIDEPVARATGDTLAGAVAALAAILR